MSLATFVKEQVQEADKSNFVARKDLVQAYINWRQRPNSDLPTMQLTDLTNAERDSATALPAGDWRPALKVASRGQKGLVRDCWQGYELMWAGGSRVEPEPIMPEPVRSKQATTVHGCFHFMDHYDPKPLSEYLLNRVNPDVYIDGTYLNRLLKHTVDTMLPSIKSDWAMRSLECGGLLFNVFVGRSNLQGVSAMDAYL